MKKAIKILLIVIGVFFAIGIIGAIFSENKPSNENVKVEEPAKLKASPVVEIKEEPKSNWAYEEQTDKMDDETSYFAQTTSITVLDFDFPYNGGSIPTLTVRKNKKGMDVYLQVSKGQFTGNIMDNKFTRVKFDDEKPFNVGYTGASDGSSNIIFLASEAKLVQKLKQSKTLLIECEFYNEGRRQMEFNIEGLDWKH